MRAIEIRDKFGVEHMVRIYAGHDINRLQQIQAIRSIM